MHLDRTTLVWILPLVVACGSSEAREEGPDAMAELAPSTGEVPPIERDALLDGNKGRACDGAPIATRVEALLAKMSLEQKLAEMHGASGTAVNGLYAAGGDPALGIPPFEMVDGPRGVRAGTATAFPVGIARGATWDPLLERRVGLAMGLEAAARGANVLLAPTMNLLRHPAWGRAQETYSEDSFHLGEMALAYVSGVQNHVLACAKHFAVNSIENTRFTVSADLDERTLREVYLPHFRKVVEVGRVACVMSAYNRVNGTFCAENAHLLHDVLKGEWGFSGFVLSDWYLGTRSTVPSVLAGLDIEMPSAVFYGETLGAAVAAGEVPESAVDDAVRRILRQKACFGLDSAEAPDEAVLESEEHIALSRDVAEKSMVLLKNDAGALPLRPWHGRIAVIGALADVANLGDRGSSLVTPSYTVTPFAGLKTRGGADVALVATDTPSDEELDEVAAADAAIVVVGLTYREEGEFIPTAQEGGELARGGDRADLELPAAQQDLVRAVAARAKKTIVVLECGAAVTVRSWVDEVDALLVAWYPGMEGGTALARLLFGDASPSGKLPVTFPRSMDDLPPWDFTSDQVTYGYLHGYRLLDGSDAEPEFAFGFGLGYSTFRLGRLRLDRRAAAPDAMVRVSVDVMNDGDTMADEVVQLYVSVPASRHERAPRELRGFRRVSLAPGEVKTVLVDLDVRELAVFDEAAGTFVVEKTEYVVHAGTSSRDLPLEARFAVE